MLPQHAAGPVAITATGPAAFRGREAGTTAWVRIRWSHAESPAVAPAPWATTICLKGIAVQSPAAKTPGMDRRRSPCDTGVM